MNNVHKTKFCSTNFYNFFKNKVVSFVRFLSSITKKYALSGWIEFIISVSTWVIYTSDNWDRSSLQDPKILY